MVLHFRSQMSCTATFGRYWVTDLFWVEVAYKIGMVLPGAPCRKNSRQPIGDKASYDLTTAF
jgi:hypothetical protein